MKTFIFIVVLFLILIVGGGLTTMLISTNGAILPILTTTTVPDASPTMVLPWKAEQIFLLIGFLLFNLVGIAVTLAGLFWLVDRGLRNNRASTPTNDKTPATTTAAE